LEAEKAKKKKIKVNAEETEQKDNVEDLEQARSAKEEEEKAPKEDKAEPKEEDFKSKFYYLAAEMDNLRKRIQKEKEDYIKYGNENILRDIITVMDTFTFTINAIEKVDHAEVKNIVIGLNMVQRQLMDTLGHHGLSTIDTEKKIFDPNFHEAVEKKQAKGFKANQIIEEQAKGYLLNGRLLRAAKVVVAE
jgi:molecular chaperone GrpE